MLIRSNKSQFNIGNLPQAEGIAGFILAGTGTITILFRGLGPKLVNYGYGSVALDLAMDLKNSSNFTLESNDDWDASGGTSNAVAPAPGNLAELQTNADLNWRQFDPDINSLANPDRVYTDIGPLYPSECLFWHSFTLTGANQNYTVVLSGPGGAIGTGRLEMYVMNASGSASLAQISTRGNLEGDNVVLSNEFEIGESAGNITVMQRALGPSLSAIGISYPESNPSVELYDNTGCLISQNDNWVTTVRVDEYMDVFGTDLDYREAVIYNTLIPGTYTTVTRARGGYGVGLNETYISSVASGLTPPINE